MRVPVAGLVLLLTITGADAAPAQHFHQGTALRVRLWSGPTFRAATERSSRDSLVLRRTDGLELTAAWTDVQRIELWERHRNTRAGAVVGLATGLVVSLALVSVVDLPDSEGSGWGSPGLPGEAKEALVVIGGTAAFAAIGAVIGWRIQTDGWVSHDVRVQVIPGPGTLRAGFHASF